MLVIPAMRMGMRMTVWWTWERIKLYDLHDPNEKSNLDDHGSVYVQIPRFLHRFLARQIYACLPRSLQEIRRSREWLCQQHQVSACNRGHLRVLDLLWAVYRYLSFADYWQAGNTVRSSWRCWRLWRTAFVLKRSEMVETPNVYARHTFYVISHAEPRESGRRLGQFGFDLVYYLPHLQHRLWLEMVTFCSFTTFLWLISISGQKWRESAVYVVPVSGGPSCWTWTRNASWPPASCGQFL
jgi:hypothetical protein